MTARGRGQSQSPITLPHLKPPEKGFHPIRCHSHRMRSCRSQPQRDADRVGSRGQANAFSVVMARHSGIVPAWARFSLAVRIICPAVFSSQVPGRKKTGGREGRSRSLKWKLSVSTGRQDWNSRNESSQSRCVQRQRGISPSMTHTQCECHQRAGETCTSFNDGAAFATTFGEICSSDRRWMAAGDDRVCMLVAARGPNPAAWGVSTADPGVSEESAKKGLHRRREEIWDAAALAVYILQDAPPILAGNGGLHSHRLTRRHWAIGSFVSPARTYGRAVSRRDYKIVFSWKK